MIAIFQKSNIWKLALMVMGSLILLLTILYSDFWPNNLRIKEEKHVFLFRQALEEFIKQDVGPNYSADITFLQTIIDSFPLPVIFEDETGYLEGQNFSEVELNDPDFLKRKKQEFLASGEKPIIGTGYAQNIYWFNSPVLNYIKLFPYVQGLLVGLYILLGYVLFNSSRRSEQNRVWAGMAKETAHQLGTPISAIMGWIEILKENNSEDTANMEIIEELKNDVNRLELVAERFSKIGSEPVLTETNIYEELVKVKEYFQKRAPKKVQFNFIQPDQVIVGRINRHLFDWVIENLIRNSLDAMDGQGVIGCKLHQTGDNIYIELTDDGHGISAANFKSVFKPGYSTKKRGWGLGLSLAKRIIEQYHGGKIFVKSSKPNEETKFCIILPSQ
ncbi:MAG: integral membrane sensor signal transduction histidine kinase [Bacteroidetes bacterium OLB9]|nr:MAG: integral membrane sensor signal transduction histidine kinase [Bacteroidetes bacterium OLB9]